MKLTSHKRTINVTQREIDTGMREDSKACMIAEAVKHSIPGTKNVSVDVSTIRFTDKKGERYIYQTPIAAQKALVQFDQGIATQPFTFQVHTLYQILPKRPREPVKVVVKKSSNRGNPTTRAPIVIGGNPPVRTMAKGLRRFGLRSLTAGQKVDTTPLTSETNTS